MTTKEKAKELIELIPNDERIFLGSVSTKIETIERPNAILRERKIVIEWTEATVEVFEKLKKEKAVEE